MKKEYYDKKAFNKILSKVDKKSRAMPRVKKLMKELDVLSKRAEPGSTADKKKGIAIQIKVKLDAIAAEIMSVGNDFKNGQDIQKISNTSASEIKENKGKGMKLIDRLVKEYTQPLNEARAKKWTDDDKFWSKNITGKAANDGEGKYDITDIWGRGPFPVKKFQDTKAIDGDKKTFGDQNAKQHAFWKRRYDIEITGQHFDALAKNGKGAVVPLLYNRGGITRDTELFKSKLSGVSVNYKRFKDSKHKVFISGTNQDIYDFFLGNDWAKDNRKPEKLFKDKLGVESYRETLRKNKKFPNTLISNDVNASEEGEFWVDSEQDYMMRQKGYTNSMSPKQVRDLDKTMAKQGFKWDNNAGRYPERSGGAYVDRKGKRLDFDNYKPF